MAWQLRAHTTLPEYKRLVLSIPAPPLNNPQLPGTPAERGTQQAPTHKC